MSVFGACMSRKVEQGMRSSARWELELTGRGEEGRENELFAARKGTLRVAEPPRGAPDSLQRVVLVISLTDLVMKSCLASVNGL